MRPMPTYTIVPTHDSDQLESSLATLVTVHELFFLANFSLYCFFCTTVNCVTKLFPFCKQCKSNKT